MVLFVGIMMFYFRKRLNDVKKIKYKKFRVVFYEEFRIKFEEFFMKYSYFLELNLG